MRAVIGLGNPGRRYEKTRHNVGFEVVDGLAARHGLQFKRSWRIGADSCRVLDRDVLLVKPQLYMNVSGDPVGKLLRFYKVGVDDLIVVQTADATLVAPKRAEERVREVVKALEQQELNELL